MAVVSMKQLLEAGVHFGHQTRRWNPKMAKYIFTERNGIYIIDLQKTVKKLDEAYNYVKEVAAEGGDILFVGTKKQAQESIRDEALRCGMHYVNARWLGGMMTNFRTIRKRNSSEQRERPKAQIIAPSVPRNLKKVSAVGGSSSAQMASSGSASVAGVQVGQMIEHERFGLGEVLKVEGTGDNAKATIHFKNAGDKQLLLRFARFKVVE